MKQTLDGNLVKWQVGTAWHVGCLLGTHEGNLILLGDSGVNPDAEVLVKPWPDGNPVFVRYGDLLDREVRK